MIEYYREALFEAVTYCIMHGFDDNYIASLDVLGFGELYKYLKRIEARRRVSLIGDLRTAANAGKKSYKSYLDMVSEWLPKQEQEGGVTLGSSADFRKQTNKTENRGKF